MLRRKFLAAILASPVVFPVVKAWSIPGYIYATDYGVTASWNGADATSTDDTAAINAAINAAKTWVPAGMVDQGGVAGQTIVFPKGPCLISSKIVLPSFVRLQGVNMFGTVLKMSDNFTPHDHFIDAGDATTRLSAFACGVSDMYLYSRNQNADVNMAMLYTNNGQDNDPAVGHCRIAGGNRSAIRAEIGYGGATNVFFRNITLQNDGNANGGIMNPIAYFGYGPGNLVKLEGFEVSCPVGPQVGIRCAGGNFRISNFHAEVIATGIMVDLANGGWVSVEDSTGGSGVGSVVTINNRPAQAGCTKIKTTRKNGATAVVINGLPGGSGTTSDIFAEQTF